MPTNAQPLGDPRNVAALAGAVHSFERDEFAAHAE
jgi:hypothetical protein